MPKRSKKALIVDLKKFDYVNEDGKLVKIPQTDIERFLLIAELGMKNGFNKNGFMEKMMAGYLMDSETTRRYLVTSGLNNLTKVQDIVDEIFNRTVKEKRTLCEEEVKTIEVVSKVASAFNEISESIVRISGARSQGSGKYGKIALPPGDDSAQTPNFYKNETHIHLGEKKEKIVEQPDAPVVEASGS